MVKEHFDELRYNQLRVLVMYWLGIVMMMVIIIAVTLHTRNPANILFVIAVGLAAQQVLQIPHRYYGVTTNNWLWSVDLVYDDEIVVHALEIKLVGSKPKIHFAWIARGTSLRVLSDEGDYFLVWKQYGVTRHLKLAEKRDGLELTQGDHLLYRITQVHLT